MESLPFVETSLFDAPLERGTPPRPPGVRADVLVAPPPAPVRPATPPAPAATRPARPPGGAGVSPVMKAPVLLAVDGNSLAHRAFHAYGAEMAHYGFIALLAAVCDRAAPERLVVGFDCRVASWRRDRYTDYKSQRAAKDPALSALLDDAPLLLTDLGIHVMCVEGWEADDVVGSAAAAAEAAGWRCVVATSDRDAFALVSETTTVLRLRSGMDNALEITPWSLRDDVGVGPEQYLEFSALRGDTSDNLRGIPGFGPSRAATLLRAFPTVDAAAADPIGCRSVLGRPWGQVLLDDLADPSTSVFRRNVELMAIRRDLPLDLDACRRRSTPLHLAQRLAAWDLRGLDTRLALAVALLPESPPPPDAPPS